VKKKTGDVETANDFFLEYCEAKRKRERERYDNPSGNPSDLEKRERERERETITRPETHAILPFIAL
jgi:hypothetical protein